MSGPGSLRALADEIDCEMVFRFEYQKRSRAHADQWEADNYAHAVEVAAKDVLIAALRERLEAAMVLLAEGETVDCCTYCGGIATYTAKGDGSPGTWNVNHRQDCRYAALASLPEVKP